jgi:hypothetical protein
MEQIRARKALMMRCVNWRALTKHSTVDRAPNGKIPLEADVFGDENSDK